MAPSVSKGQRAKLMLAELSISPQAAPMVLGKPWPPNSVGCCKPCQPPSPYCLNASLKPGVVLTWPFEKTEIVKDNNVSLKITRFRHEPTKRFGKDIDINKNLKEFYKVIKKYKLDDIICIDETSIKSLQKRHHCYSDVGKRCVIKTESQEVFKKYTGIFSISTKGILGYTLYEKSGINTDRLYEFLEKNITSKYKKKLIILDNASSHRSERIKELVNKNNKLLYSVPYQHFTNSIENFFSMLKSKLQKLDGLTHDEIKKNIKKALKDIPIESYVNIFKGAYDRTEKYVKTTKPRVKKTKNYLE